MTRLFLTSYQKSGTHQAMQMLMHDIPSIVDRSGNNTLGMGAYGFKSDDKPLPRYRETIEALESFGPKAYGHLSYLPEYVEALCSQPTKVLFNVRDPRDVVVAEYGYMLNMRKEKPQDKVLLAFQNVVLPGQGGLRLMDGPDPIGELIKVAAIRWENYIGWIDEDFVTVLHYEDLRLRTPETVAEVRAALAGCSLPPEGAMVSQARDTAWSGKHFRKGLVGEHETTFTDEHKELAAELLGPLMERLGYHV